MQDGGASMSVGAVAGGGVHWSGWGRRPFRLQPYHPAHRDPDQEPARSRGNRLLLPERQRHARQDGREPDPQPDQRDFGQHQARQAVHEQRRPGHSQAHRPVPPSHQDLSHAQGQPNDNQREENQCAVRRYAHLVFFDPIDQPPIPRDRSQRNQNGQQLYPPHLHTIPPCCVLRVPCFVFRVSCFLPLPSLPSLIFPLPRMNKGFSICRNPNLRVQSEQTLPG